MLLSEAFELYRLEYITYRNQSKKTEEMNTAAMNSVVEFLGGIHIEELTFDMIRKWKLHLSKTRSNNTVRGYIIKLRVVLKYLGLKGVNVLNYEIVGVPKREQVPVTFITPEEVESLIACVFKPSPGYSTHNRYRNRAIIALMYASGVRVSELCGLDRLSLQQDRTFTVVGKGGKARLCFFDERSLCYIDEYLNYRPDCLAPLFISELTGKRISKGTVQEIFRNAKNKGHLDKPVHPHTIRHSFATNLLRNNTNIVHVRDFLGHSSVQTTEMYMHVVNEDLKAVYREKHTI